MDKVKHIKNITIENFKCFDYFKAEGFGKYNIILGDNNVGKTSFLESLLFDENISQTIYNFQSVLFLKNILSSKESDTINPFIFFINRYSEKKNILVNFKFTNISEDLNISFQTVNINQLKEEEKHIAIRNLENFRIENELIKSIRNGETLFRQVHLLQNFEGFSDFLPYISSTANYSKDLIGFYTENFETKESKRNLINNLKILIPDIADIEITLSFSKSPLLGVWIENRETLLPLPMFGDGTIRLFRMIMEIIVSKNKYLCIDEIDTGIHYSKYKDFSRIVLKTAAANNVQLFISTHNSEFLKSFKEVLEEQEFMDFQNDTKSFTLKKLPSGDIKAYRYDFEELEFAIEQENELR